MKKRKGQMSDSLFVGVCLTLGGGFQDAYSYNCRDHVFANAQTGNIVLLGQNVANLDWERAFHYLIPIAAFAGGVYAAEWIHHCFFERQRIHWRQVVLGIEIFLLFLAGLLPQSYNITANALMSFACAMQVDSFRKFRGIPCATTMCIGNLRSGMEMICKYQMTGEEEARGKAFHYLFIILTFTVGAAFGAMTTERFQERAIWIAGILFLTAFLVMFRKEEKAELEKIREETKEHISHKK